LLSILIIVSSNLYVISEFIQLLGYITLMITFIMVLKHGKKKGKN
jgi:hypothetical protein